MNIVEKLPFVWLFLDETAVVTGYDEEKESFLFSNEVKDTTTQPFVVKWQKKGLGTAATGLWRAIKSQVRGCGGSYSCKVYVAFRDEGKLKIGAITMSGSARSAWIEFKNEVRGDINKKAVVMDVGELTTAPKNKKIEFTPPTFTLNDIKPETDKEALELCKEVEAYFAEYFKRPTAAHTAAPESPEAEQGQPPKPEMEAEASELPPEDDQVPF